MGRLTPFSLAVLAFGPRRLSSRPGLAPASDVHPFVLGPPLQEGPAKADSPCSHQRRSTGIKGTTIGAARRRLTAINVSLGLPRLRTSGPEPTDRFGDDLFFRRVNTRRNWVIPKPRAGRLALIAAIVLSLLLFVALNHARRQFPDARRAAIIIG